MAFTTRNPYQKYRQTEVESLSQGNLIVMLYDGAIRFLEEASRYVQDFRNYDKANERLLKAQDVISELMVSLNMDAGDVAKNLLSIYIYAKNTLIEANMQKSNAKIDEVIRLLKPLRESWSEIADREPATTSAEPSRGGVSFTG